MLKNAGADALQTAASRSSWHSSQHNLGGPRTINMPTVPLEAAAPANHRVATSFKLRRARTRRPGQRRPSVDFEEFDEPTLVHSHRRQHDMRIEWHGVDRAGDGAAVRADVRIRDGAAQALARSGARAVRSRCAWSSCATSQLGLLVPKEMIESFYVPAAERRRRPRRRYSNYRTVQRRAARHGAAVQSAQAPACQSRVKCLDAGAC